jgi:hypothetical protein
MTPATASAPGRKLTLADISDLRAYERERGEFRPYVTDSKRRRRLHRGTLVTVVFENRETMRFQVQEMHRRSSTSAATTQKKADQTLAVKRELVLVSARRPKEHENSWGELDRVANRDRLAFIGGMPGTRRLHLLP